MLQLEGVTKSYPPKTVLEDVSFSLADGEILALLGPSGGGKSTLLQLIGGLLPPDAGSILWNGQDMAGVPPHQRGFGLVFQDYALFPHLNVGENVAFGLRLQKRPQAEIQQRVAQALDWVGLGGMAGRDIHSLSGGEQQRVALARSLAPRPRLLMLDEPLGALDAGLRARLRTDLRAILKAEGLSALYVTHDQEEAFAVADRVGVLFAGRLAALLSPRDLYFSPPSAQVADFLGLGNQVPILALEPAGVGWQVQTVLGAFFITEKTEHLFLHPNSLHLSALEGTQAHIHYQPIGDKAPRWLAEAPPTWCFECIGQEFRGESTRLRLRHESGLRLQAVTLGLT